MNITSENSAVTAGEARLVWRMLAHKHLNHVSTWEPGIYRCLDATGEDIGFVRCRPEVAHILNQLINARDEQQ